MIILEGPWDLGPALKRLRAEDGQPQRLAAKRAGTTAQYLSLVERGQKEPRGKYLDAPAVRARLHAGDRPA